jgi:uncharacterized protein (DUF1330 family)
VIIAPATRFPVAEFSHAESLRGSHVSFSIRPAKTRRLCKTSASSVAPFGARVLARGNAAVALVHGLKERNVIVEYPSLEKATAAYSSTAYREALKALGDSAVRDFRIVEGLE